MIQIADTGAVRTITLDRPQVRSVLDIARLIDGVPGRTLGNQALEERRAAAACAASEDAKEALAAGLERREPRFKKR